MLNVSRSYLIKLLETEEIPFRLIGKHRRITYEDLQEYQRLDDAKRRTAAEDLRDLALVLARSATDDGHRTSLDDVLAAFGHTRESITAIEDDD